jgi:hypothetical protein
MPKRSCSWTSAIAACLLAAAAPARAQTSVELGPVFGYYRPLGRFEPASVYSTSLPGDPSELAGVSWGGAAQVRFGGRLGAEVQVSVANSIIPGGNTPAGPGKGVRAAVAAALAQGQYDVSPMPARFHVWLGAGPALVRHGGSAYAPYGSPVSAAGAASVGVSARVASRAEVALGVTTLLYPFDLAMPAALQRNPGSLEHGFQTDAMVHLGVRWGGQREGR